MKKPFISVIIPVKKVNDYLRQETIPAILAQTYQDFEIIIVPDKASKEKFKKTKIIPSWPKTGPADKKDLGAKRAKGEILAFLDDDAYPEKNWLKNAIEVFKEDRKIVGVCGPGVTPPQDNLRRKASGYVWSSLFGSGGAGTYRCAVYPRQEIDDYPTFNLLVKKKDFWQVGGFDSHFWPGEDTRLCHDLTRRLGKKIIYDPKVLVFHHRREVFGPHLAQISRYAIHRGHFARILPATSFRLGYLLPSLFVLGLFIGFFLSFAHPLFKSFYLSALIVYLFALLITAIWIYLKEKNLGLALLIIPSIFVTHFVYGILFIKGFLARRLRR